MFPEFPVLPLLLSWHDPSGPFALEATVTDWQPAGRTRPAGVVTLTLGTVTFDDADKGRYALVDVVLTLREEEGRLEPVALLTPGALSEFQQAGLLDAVASALNDGLHPSRSSR